VISNYVCLRSHFQGGYLPASVTARPLSTKGCRSVRFLNRTGHLALHLVLNIDGAHQNVMISPWRDIRLSSREIYIKV
jgi:hypothetical protein